MILLSTLRGAAAPTRAALARGSLQHTRQMSDHRTMNITASRFQWNKFKDMLHLYVVGTAVPLLGGIFLLNVFVGPATLSELPEDRTPEEYEYHKSPITRFLVRYFCAGRQMEYEKGMQYLWEVEHKRQLRKIEARVRELMSERGDYKAWYFAPDATRKYQRIVRKETEELYERRPA
ncbi:NADH dehydrogenase [ubiquinone] 1 beta subcomplex subunit 5, mitochondrial-like [Pollicipes pollicipes]|uniref:NADH dehydrogenase [ubiquinone] 1 beta subcomplex subunit 5, mitochondrial-like n=1 Tax=Pollicipes pollicipes TaxID=41117 RepID=UPI001884C2BD|nr:NADH dehydrogenase [ubiquinone] 1 beta subcomplex subunit 5, mitochondrial-like [Pollicipes pollicipes]